MRTATTAAVGALAALLIAGTAVADSADPNQTAPRRDPAPAAAPSLSVGPGPRPTPMGSHFAYVYDYELTNSLLHTSDTAVDQVLGVLPDPAADKPHAKIYIVNDDGDIECWDLDTFFPEPC